MNAPTERAARTTVMRRFSRGRYALVLGAAAAAIGLFVLWSLNIGHGIYAFVVLGLAALALVFFGGPEQLARTISIGPDEIRIRRFHRIGTVVPLSELASFAEESDPDPQGTQNVLVLTPHDPVAFFSKHRELRIVRSGDTARIAF